jgi:hypothetical protein
MCGSVSAIGLQEREREYWPVVRERLREPGRMMAMMRGLLGDTEVAVVAAVAPRGAVTVLAILATSDVIVDEIHLIESVPGEDGLWRAMIGDDEVRVLVGTGTDGRTRPLAILTTPWIEQHLLPFARTLWRGR